MEDLLKVTSDLKNEIKTAMTRLHFSDLESERSKLDKQVTQPDFWDDPMLAQQISKRHAVLIRRITPWEELTKEIDDLVELLGLNDMTLRDDLARQLKAVQRQFGQLKSELKYNGRYDSHDVIMSIYAGAGGTDAQDWAQMLARMYSRWAERERIGIKVIEESIGEEAGLKSLTCELSGNFVYGRLKGEHGVHRLVRLSPFNADHLRQTSFAKVEVLPEISSQENLEIDEKDLRIDVYRSGGHGGQSVNTTDSAVRITHIPTGIVVAIQNERSQLQNKEMAFTILRSKLLQLQIEQHQERIDQLRGPNQSAEWGNQIRSYVQHPYKQVKDLRTRYETSDIDAVLDGDIGPFIEAYLEYSIGDSR